MKNRINFNKVLVPSLFVAVAVFTGACDKTRPVVIPCPVCVDPNATPRADCYPVPQKSFIYCDEPELMVMDNGRYGVKNPVCRNEKGEVISEANAASSSQTEGFYLRAPEICDPAGPSTRSTILVQLKQDYSYNIRSPLALKTSCPETDGSCENIPKLRAKNITMRALPEDIKISLGIMPVAGDTDSNNLILTRDMQVLRRKYHSSVDMEKLLAPHHYYCTPGPILGCIGGACVGQLTVSATIQTSQDNTVGCQPGVVSMYGALARGGADAQNAGGGNGVAGTIRGIVDTGVKRVAEKRTTQDVSADSSAATAKSGVNNLTAPLASGQSGIGDLSGGSGLGSGAAGGSGAGASGNTGAGTGNSGGLIAASNTSAPPVMVGGESQEDVALSEGEKVAYDSASGGGGGARKADNPLAGLMGAFGPKAAGGAGAGKAGTVNFGKVGAAGAGPGGTLTDAELEALLNANSGSSLFDIASRRYFKWGGTVMGVAAQKQQ